MSTMHPRARRVLAPGLGLLAIAALAACTPDVGMPSSSVDPSPSDVVVSPTPSSEPTVVPLAEIEQPMPISCALDMAIVPGPQDPVGGPIAGVRVELLGQGSDDLAMAAVVGDDLVVTPSVEAGDPTEIVEAAIARFEDAGHPIEHEVVLAEAVGWTFDDLCAGSNLMHEIVGTADGADVMSWSMAVDGRLEVGMLDGAPLPQAVVDFDAAHPGIVRVFADVQHFG